MEQKNLIDELENEIVYLAYDYPFCQVLENYHLKIEGEFDSIGLRKIADLLDKIIERI